MVVDDSCMLCSLKKKHNKHIPPWISKRSNYHPKENIVSMFIQKRYACAVIYKLPFRLFQCNIIIIVTVVNDAIAINNLIVRAVFMLPTFVHYTTLSCLFVRPLVRNLLFAVPGFHLMSLYTDSRHGMRGFICVVYINTVYILLDKAFLVTPSTINAVETIQNKWKAFCEQRFLPHRAFIYNILYKWRQKSDLTNQVSNDDWLAHAHLPFITQRKTTSGTSHWSLP